MTQTVAFLAGGALLAFAIATLLAGRSLWFVTRTVIGWSAAVLAVVLAFAAFALVGFHYLTDQAPTTAVSGALGVGGALIVIGVAAKATRRRRKPARAPVARAAFTRRTATKKPPTPTPALTGAARDAIAALAGLGYARKDAAGDGRRLFAGRGS
jgi:hypothetical protein